MTPTQTIVSNIVGTFRTTDALGRALLLRQLSALDTLRLFKLAGPVLSQNEAWLSLASLAFSVLEIDGIPVPTPASESQIEAIVERLGEDGLEAVASASALKQPKTDFQAEVGNSPGTLS